MRNREFNRQSDTSSRSTDKKAASNSTLRILSNTHERSKPRILSDTRNERSTPLILSDTRHKLSTPLILSDTRHKLSTPLILSDTRHERSTPPVLETGHERSKPIAQRETTADGHLDSASTSTRDAITHQRNHSTMKYRFTDILSRKTHFDIYIGERNYSSTNEENPQKLAFKVLRKDSFDLHFKRFQREAEILERLKGHPNIVSYQDFQIHDGRPFLVMDYAQGGTLRDIHPQGQRLDQGLIVYYVKQIADALDYIHKQKVIHLDIKPTNIFLKETRASLQRELLIGDFGFARVVEHEPPELGIFGTTEYIAPEYLEGKPTYASDLYSLAIIVYEWLSGHRPFEGSFSDEIRRKRQIQSQHLYDSPPSLSDKFSDISPAIEEVVFKALAKKPEDRYPDVKAFAEALEQACRPTASWLYSRIGFAKALEQFHRLRTSTTQIWPAIHNILPLFKQIRRFRALSGNDVFFEERYPATPVHGKSGVYKSHLLNGCAVDATQMLLRDQGIDKINDIAVAEAVEYTGLGDFEELGTHEEKMPDALKKFGFISYEWTPRGDTKDLKEALKRGYSFASSIKTRSVYGRGLHVVVIDKITDSHDEDGSFVYIRDSRYDEPYKVTNNEWEQARIGGDVIPDKEARSGDVIPDK